MKRELDVESYEREGKRKLKKEREGERERRGERERAREREVVR